MLHSAFTTDAALGALAARCEVVTIDWENVSVEALRTSRREARVCPPSRRSRRRRIACREKRLFERLEIPTTRWRAVSDAPQLERALRDIGLPGVLKTRRMGYDGKGQAVQDARGRAPRLGRAGQVPLLYEELVPFDWRCPSSAYAAAAARSPSIR